MIGLALDGFPMHQQTDDEYLYLEDVTGKRFITTQLGGTIKVEANRSASALESMSRFCVHPKWVNYLPPTMSPPSSSKLGDFLEHPNEAFDYYRKQGAIEVICEEKHMGSRAIIQIVLLLINWPKPLMHRVYGMSLTLRG